MNLSQNCLNLEMKQTLLIHINAPMQSWGVCSRYERRGAGEAPSKSAICGMACAACGAAKDSTEERRIIAGFNAAQMTTFGLRSGRILTDYHTVQNFARADGSVDKSGTVQTYRHYWSDARYVVLLESEDRAFLERLHTALKNPHWGIWFGRKCCIPAEPLIQRELLSPDEAREVALRGCSPDAVEIYAETDIFEEGTDTWADVPQSFGSPDSSGPGGRSYGTRRVKRSILSVHPVESPEPFFDFDAPL